MGTPHWPTRQLGLSREKGFETKFAPAETKGRIEASLFWFHTTVKSTALKGSPPQRRFMRTVSRALSINRAQICTTHPKKDQNIMFSPTKIPPYKKGKVKQKNFGWEFSREDPFFVSRRNGGLLRDGMVIAMVTCYKGSTSGKTKEDRGYISTRGPWDFCWGSWTWTTLGRTLDSPLSGGKVVYDRLGPTHPEGDLMRPCHLLIAPQKSFSPKNWLNFWRKNNYIGDILHW